MSSRYGSERIGRGLMHFVLGKGVSAVAGVSAMLLVVRELSVESFAAYSVLVVLFKFLKIVVRKLRTFFGGEPAPNPV